MNYIKEAIDYAMTLKKVKGEMQWRNQNNFAALGIHARFLRRDNINPNRYQVQINFDYYNTNNLIQEDFFVVIEWDGNQYIPIGFRYAHEVDGID